ncbi:MULTISPECIES: hypothetical protein [Acidobacteriaceae]|uniref:hypothetical protein n=1 Tax=Acidobacteriaceae TaxID=204434 RepID=UPI00131B0316|nr:MULTISPECIES: hypothetical protein [Acidobacteriaceae]MDW5265861.1 hypothetical protein [Edaphobacter sp.]
MGQKILKQIVLGVDGFYPALWMLLLMSITMPAQQNPLSTTLPTTKLSGGFELPTVTKADRIVHDIPLSQTEDRYVHAIPLSKTPDHYLRNVSSMIPGKTGRTTAVSEKKGQQPAN